MNRIFVIKIRGDRLITAQISSGEKCKQTGLLVVDAGDQMLSITFSRQ